jgi:hypothetical protein
MRRDFTQGDSTLIYLAAHVLGRPIVIIPVCAEEAEMRIEPGVVTKAFRTKSESENFGL